MDFPRTIEGGATVRVGSGPGPLNHGFAPRATIQQPDDLQP